MNQPKDDFVKLLLASYQLYLIGNPANGQQYVGEELNRYQDERNKLGCNLRTAKNVKRKRFENQTQEKTGSSKRARFKCALETIPEELAPQTEIGKLLDQTSSYYNNTSGL
tara:strand:+ start:69 stop:401 length:333 start_codon:yes stop_codon:yes gene_type:complete